MFGDAWVTADIEWLAHNVPRSKRFDDVYFDVDRPVEESAFNFLDGNRLPARWGDHFAADQRAFCIGESGFGTGLNFMLAAEAWRSSNTVGRLHFVSVENYPLSHEQLRQAHASLPKALTSIGAELRDAYHVKGRGFHRIEFPERRLVLTLIIDDAAAGLAQLEARIDAWFLDGFSPAKNPQMWCAELYRQLARLSVEGTTLATFTAAGHVRRGLDAAGFQMRKEPGFGSKRERLVGEFRGSRSSQLPGWARIPSTSPDSVRILGGGIAGRSLVDALSRRSIPVEIAQNDRPGGSGVPRAMVKPRLAADRSAAARFFSSACGYATAMYRRWGCFTEQDVLQGVGPDEVERVNAMVAAWPDWLSVEDGDVRYSGAGYVDTSKLPRLDDISCSEAPVVVDASGSGLAHYKELFCLAAYRGQVTLFDDETHELDGVISAGHYILGPQQEHPWQTGATFDPVRLDDQSAAHPRSADDRRNLSAADALIPGISKSALIRDSWAGLRMATADRLPVVGPVIDVDAYVEALAPWSAMRERVFEPASPTRFVLGALGSRGFTTAPLCAELLVSQWFDEPWPIERNIALLLHSARFVIRRIKRGERTAG